MCKPIRTQALPSKTGLVEKLGGESQMSFLLMNLSESITDDSDLQMIFDHMGMEELSAEMESLINSAFLSNLFSDDARNNLIMKNYAIFELGINTRHFKKLKSHFESALHDSWIEEDVIEECIQCFAALQSVFEEEGKDFERAAMAQRDVENRILTTPAPFAAWAAKQDEQEQHMRINKKSDWLGTVLDIRTKLDVQLLKLAHREGQVDWLKNFLQVAAQT